MTLSVVQLTMNGFSISLVLDYFYFKFVYLTGHSFEHINCLVNHVGNVPI